MEDLILNKNTSKEQVSDHIERIIIEKEMIKSAPSPSYKKNKLIAEIVVIGLIIMVALFFTFKNYFLSRLR